MAATIEQLQVEIISNSKSAAKGIDALASSLGRLKKATKNTGLDKFASQAKKTKDALNSTSSSNEKSAQSFTTLATKAGVAVLALKKISSVLSKWIGESTQYVEDLNLFTVSMGEFVDEAKSYADTVSELMGIDPAEWMRNQGIFMTLATGFGVASDRANIMSKNLTQLGYDLSSFFNLDTEEAFQKLESGLAGELEPLRRLGYDLSVARLQQEAYALGIEKKVTAMTQAEKAELRYYTIMTQVTKSHGDMARTLEAPANQLRIFKAQVTQVARSLGNVFIPALNAVLPYAIAFVKAIRMIADAMSNFFGFALPEIDYSSLDSLVGGTDDLTDGLEDASKKAKKLKQNLLGIDELNIISPETSDGSDTSVSGGGLGFELPTYDFLGDAISSRVDAVFGGMKKWLEDIGNMAKNSGIVEAFEGFKEAVANFADSSIVTTIREIFNILGNNVVLTIITGITDALKVLTDILNGDLNSAVNDFKDLLANGTLIPLTGIAEVIDAICGTDLAGWFTDLKESINDLDLTELSGFERLETSIGKIKESFNSLKESFVTLGENLEKSGAAKVIKDFFVWLVESSANVVLNDIATALEIIAEYVQTLAALLSGDLYSALNGIKDLYATLTFAPLLSTATVIDSIFGTDMVTKINDVKEAVQNFDLSGFITNFVKKVGDGIKDVGEWFGKLPSKIWEGLTSAFDKVVQWGIDTYDNMTTKVGETIDDVVKWFAELPGKIGYELGYALGTIVQWTIDTKQKLSEKISNIISSVKTWFTEMPGKIKEAISTTPAKIEEWYTETKNTFKTKINDIVRNVKTWFSGTPAKIKDAIDGAKSKLTLWATEMILKAKIEIPRIVNEIVGFFKTIPDKLKKLGKDIWDGLIKGLKDSWYVVSKAATDFADSFVEGFKDALGIHSPSRVFYALSEFVIQGFNNGFTDYGKSSTGVVSKWANSISGVTPTMSFAVDTSALKYYDSDSFSRSVSANVSSHTSFAATGFKEGMGEFYKEYIEPMVTQMATDMRRQADKNEQTIVQIGNRTVSDAVTTQQRANGYVFAK